MNITQHIQQSTNQLFSVQDNYIEEEEDYQDENEEEMIPVYIPPSHIPKRKEHSESNDSHHSQEEEKMNRINTQFVEKTLQHEQNTKLSDDTTEEFSSGEEYGGAEEFLQWQERELLRLKQEYIDHLTYIHDLQTIEELTQNDQKEQKEPEESNERKQWKFMQKYYHIGSFFRDGGEWDVSHGKWDFDAATGDDWMDKLALPKILQTKRWGKKGQGKHTTLREEDTTFRLYD